MLNCDGDNNNCLTLYGNCLKILSRKDLYNNINILKFNYFNFDLITCKKYFGLVKAFKDIKKFYFSYNNIYSIYQLTKLENFDNLENLHITNNEVCCSGKLVRLFVIYRIRKLKTFNNESVVFEEKVLSNQIFNTFDNLILIKENQIKNEDKKKNLIDKEDNIDNNKNNISDNKEDKNSDDDCEEKFNAWNFIKQNLSTALYSIISENEE